MHRLPNKSVTVWIRDRHVAGVMQTAYPYVCVFLANSVTGEAEEAGEKF